MLKFEPIDGPAAALDQPNVDADQIIPARFLTRSRAEGFGAFLFHDLRRDEDGTPKPDFALNRKEAQSAQVLVADRNFGSGSSREHAVWALLDAGFRVVIAPSFGEMFSSNAMKNGLLPVVLPDARCQALIAALGRAPGAHMQVDLETQTVTGPIGPENDGGRDGFEIDPFRKQMLLSGTDDISFIMTQQDSIDRFEARLRADQPWL